MAWEVLSTRIAFDGRFKVITDELKRPDGRVGNYSWIRAADVVAVLPFDMEGQAVLVRQYRHALGQDILDVPAGFIEAGESEETAALRELREETGYVPGNLTRLGAFFISPTRQSNRMTVFAVTEAKEGIPSPEEGEFVEVDRLPWPKVLELVTGEKPVAGALAYAVLRWSLHLSQSQ